MMERFRKMVETESRAGLLRKVAGLLFGAGMFMIFVRKGSDGFGEGYSDIALLIVLGLPAVGLYYLGLRGDRLQPSGPAVGDIAPWREVFLVFGVILMPFALFQLIDVFNGSPGDSLNLVWVFALVAVLAGIGSRVAKATYMTLLAGIAVIVAYTAFWDKIVGLGDDLGAYRWLMLLLAAIFVASAMALADRRDALESKRSAELVTVAGIAAVIAGSLSLTDVAGITGATFSIPAAAESNLLWEIILLGVSVKLIAYGSFAGARGPSYVGAIGLLAFILIAGFDLNSGQPQGKVLGWPLFLVVVGLVAFLASLRPERQNRSRPRDGREYPAA